MLVLALMLGLGLVLRLRLALGLGLTLVMVLMVLVRVLALVPLLRLIRTMVLLEVPTMLLEVLVVATKRLAMWAASSGAVLSSRHSHCPHHHHYVRQLRRPEPRSRELSRPVQMFRRRRPSVRTRRN